MLQNCFHTTMVLTQLISQPTLFGVGLPCFHTTMVLTQPSQSSHLK